MTRLDIYRHITGQLVQIENEFAEGKPCDLLYQKVTEARERLCKRTGIDFEDADILEIISGMEKISEICALKMYQYALLWGDIPDGECGVFERVNKL